MVSYIATLICAAKVYIQYICTLIICTVATYIANTSMYIIIHTYIYIGGHPGAFGKNVLKKKDGSIHDLGPKASVQVFPGVSFM